MSGGWRLIRPVVSRHRRTIGVLCGWSLVATMPTLLSGRLVAVALDRGFLAGDAGLGVAVVACYGAALLFGAFATRQAIGPMGMLMETIRDELVRTVVTGGLRSAVSSGGPVGTDAAARITSQSETVRQLMSNLVMAVASAGLMVVAAVAGLLSLVPVVALGVLPIGLLVVAILVRLSRLWRRRYEEELSREEGLAAGTGTVLAGVRDVAACAAIARATWDLEHRLRAHAAAAGSVADVGGVRIAVIGLAGRLPLMLVLVMAPVLLSSDALTTGELLGAVTYLVIGLEPAWRAIAETLGNQALEVSAVLTRLAGSACAEPPPDGDGVTAPACDLALSAVTFRYGTRPALVLAHVDLRVRAGERVAVVGPSGAGKSTLVNLLAGLETPERGAVRIGGVETGRLRPSWLRRTVALVPQEAYVFAGSLRENMAYLAPTASDAALDSVVARFGLGDVVDRIGGYDNDVRPGTLSEGERQLVTLARVYLSPARVVILDEATCHLDAHAEQRSEDAFHHRPGTTLIVVAHRISSAVRAPRILLVDNGHITDGSHDTLLERAPTYANLVRNWSA